MTADDSTDRKSITKKNIVKSISNEIGLTQKVTKEIVEKVFDAIVDSLVVNQRLELRNFGVFEVKKRAARIGRNPKTSREVPIPEKYVVTFKAGKEMEERVQRLIKERELPDEATEPTKVSNPTVAPSGQNTTGQNTTGQNIAGSGQAKLDTNNNRVGENDDLDAVD